MDGFRGKRFFLFVRPFFPPTCCNLISSITLFLTTLSLLNNTLSFLSLSRSSSPFYYFFSVAQSLSFFTVAHTLFLFSLSASTLSLLFSEPNVTLLLFSHFFSPTYFLLFFCLFYLRTYLLSAHSLSLPPSLSFFLSYDLNLMFFPFPFFAHLPLFSLSFLSLMFSSLLINYSPQLPTRLFFLPFLITLSFCLFILTSLSFISSSLIFAIRVLLRTSLQLGFYFHSLIIFFYYSFIYSFLFSLPPPLYFVVDMLVKCFADQLVLSFPSLKYSFCLFFSLLSLLKCLLSLFSPLFFFIFTLSPSKLPLIFTITPLSLSPIFLFYYIFSLFFSLFDFYLLSLLTFYFLFLHFSFTDSNYPLSNF
ncbi:unnamed protein product [Acanthosepion pharaonis]|uniref:Uncharacterized protein n=1 Tax=Acanthosepion pharaonis TaxID=158019 RepID=A0A812BZM3_ACAPH|nr:unnamed protein product [Sepia pharaonis]